MWNKSIRLVGKIRKKKDKDGATVESEEECRENIPANFTDTTRNDVLLGQQMGYTASQNIEIAACNYSGERILYDEATGDCYEVKRTWQKDRSRMLTLTCERRERGGANGT